MASAVEGGLGPEVQFSHPGVQSICNTLTYITADKSGPGYPAMLGNVIRKHYRG